jgi:hypothetical protein
MTKSKQTLSASVVVEFCALCDKAHEYWIHHLELFDNNPRNAELMKSPAGQEWERLSIISHEHGLLQLIKLHDKAAMRGHITLGIDYVLTKGTWSDVVRLRLEALAKQLGDFAKQLLDARNKILSHRDLETILAGATLGAFPEGATAEYFKALQEFVNTVHDEVIGGPRPFNDLVKKDVAAFLATVKPLTGA